MTSRIFGVTIGRWLLAIAVLFMGAMAMLMLILGILLASLGSTVFYAVAGTLLLAATVLMATGHRAGAGLYSVVFALSLAWPLWSAEFNGWTLLFPLLGPWGHGNLVIATLDFNRVVWASFTAQSHALRCARIAAGRCFHFARTRLDTAALSVRRAPF